MLLAEDLLLLLLDDDKGTTAGLWIDVRVPLGAAVLAELALHGAVEVEPSASRWRTPKVIASEAATEADEVLAAALAVVTEKPRTAVDLAGRVGDGVKDRLAERLEGRGLLERADDRVLGLFPRTRWPAVATAHEAQLRDRLAPTLGLKGAEARAARRRVGELSDGDWATKAVRDAVQAAMTAITTTTVIAGTAASSG